MLLIKQFALCNIFTFSCRALHPVMYSCMSWWLLAQISWSQVLLQVSKTNDKASEIKTEIQTWLIANFKII